MLQSGNPMGKNLTPGWVECGVQPFFTQRLPNAASWGWGRTSVSLSPIGLITGRILYFFPGSDQRAGSGVPNWAF